MARMSKPRCSTCGSPDVENMGVAKEPGGIFVVWCCLTCGAEWGVRQAALELAEQESVRSHSIIKMLVERK